MEHRNHEQQYSPKSKSPEQIEKDLLEDMLQKRAELEQASGPERDAARQRFIEALRVFNSLVLDYKLPDQS